LICPEPAELLPELPEEPELELELELDPHAATPSDAVTAKATAESARVRKVFSFLILCGTVSVAPAEEL
jgi:hypothetical protein